MKVEVTDVDTKQVTVYTSIGAAARALGFRQPSISLYIKENRTKPFKGKYLFKLVSQNSEVMYITLDLLIELNSNQYTDVNY